MRWILLLFLWWLRCGGRGGRRVGGERGRKEGEKKRGCLIWRGVRKWWRWGGRWWCARGVGAGCLLRRFIQNFLVLCLGGRRRGKEEGERRRKDIWCFQWGHLRRGGWRR